MPGTSQSTPEHRDGNTSRDDHPDPATNASLPDRTLLFTLAYEMLSSTAPRLPKPLLTAPDAAEGDALADTFSIALLPALETLTPTERAVFVLREVFDLAYDEIADTVGKSPAAIRQIAHRAREHVAARRPRGLGSRAETGDAIKAFHQAAESGDLHTLLAILAPDVIFLADGGGVEQAVLSPVVGADRVARVLTAVLARVDAASMQLTQINGYPALILRRNGEIDTVIGARIDDGLITGLYAVRTPHAVATGAKDPHCTGRSSSSNGPRNRHLG